ncbi:MAG: hypothetical protein MIO92_09660 [Methanosarcinaceae archaeon]|nr:hypothetical protein [Methanosarcinaceae archaeon]
MRILPLRQTSSSTRRVHRSAVVLNGDEPYGPRAEVPAGPPIEVGFDHGGQAVIHLRGCKGHGDILGVNVPGPRLVIGYSAFDDEAVWNMLVSLAVL